MDLKFTCDEILEHAAAGILVADASGEVVFANPEAEVLLGLKGRLVAGAGLTEIMPRAARVAMKCLSSGKPGETCQCLEKAGSLVVSITRIRRPGKGPKGIVCTLRPRESTELSSVELESYRDLNRQFEAIFESSSDGIWVCNGRAEVISINSASEKLNGVRAADYIGRSIPDIMKEGLFDRSVTLEVLETKRQVSILQRMQQTGRTLLSTGTPVFDETGKITLVVINERDLTQLNAVYEELAQSRMVTEKYRDELAELAVLELQRQEIIGESAEMRQVLTAALKLAHLDASNILLLGESGTGKGLLAKFIHKNGKRSKNPFVQINCAALPETLLEAELFGYEKGAFTGASLDGKAGLFELAQGGTLFLDEIGDLPLSLQAKILKYLDDFEVMRLGSLKPISVDCTVIAATNRDLEGLAASRLFRQDLLYRLNTFTIRIPPLRERNEDIFELSSHFLRKYNRAYQMNKRFSPQALDVLNTYPFPGNVRELKSIVKRAVLLSESDLLDASIMGSQRRKTAVSPERGPGLPALTDMVRETEREMLEEAVARCRTTREVARYLGVSQPTVVRKLRKHGLLRNDTAKNRQRE